jgi:hypothetical protein
MEQRDRRGGQEYVDKDENFKSGGEIRVSDPWELNPPKNKGFHGGIKKLPMERLGRPHGCS